MPTSADKFIDLSCSEFTLMRGLGALAGATAMSNDDEFAADAGSAKTLAIDFGKLLSLEAGFDTQVTLRRLLVEEMDKLTQRAVELENPARRVRECKARLERIKMIKSVQKNVDDRGLQGVAELTQILLENFHRRLLDDFPDSVKLQDAIVAVCVSLRGVRRN
jgi:hypothetical protein